MNYISILLFFTSSILSFTTMNDFIRRRRSTLDPSRFQGWGRRRRYFEGWYFKIVIPEKKLAYAFIPGISYDEKGQGHAFLQVLDGVAATSAYYRYATELFQPTEDHFSLQLGPHFFSAERLTIDLPELQVELQFSEVHPWPKRPLAPGVMGWYGFVPRMQCYHGLVSFYHELRGSVTVRGISHSASGGTGYIEKDWGSGFPDAWVWCQSNHLTGTDRPASLMASVASIPWLRSSFVGFLATFLFEGELHLFTTWAWAQVQTSFLEQGGVELRFSAPDKELIVTGRAAAGGDLISPIAGAMTGKINESLQAELGVIFTRNGEVEYEGTASWAGLEVSNT
ncbi:MAG: tocopherol cyclase family protein, partial [Bacteroidota bacterium]